MIFGSTAPKFVVDPQGASHTVVLDYIVVTKDEPEQDILIHESIFTGHREIIIKGSYWVYECDLHLFKYWSPTTKYNTLKGYVGNEVSFYRHRNGDVLRDSSGNEVMMLFESMDEAYYQTPDYKDLLKLRFRSLKYVDLKESLI